MYAHNFKTMHINKISMPAPLFFSMQRSYKRTTSDMHNVYLFGDNIVCDCV